MPKFIAAITVSLFLLGGCTITDGNKMSEAQLSQIEEGVSTKSSIEQLLGEPTRVTKSSGDMETWSYQYIEHKYIPGSSGRGRYDGKNQSLTVIFKGPTVSQYRFTGP